MPDCKKVDEKLLQRVRAYVEENYEDENAPVVLKSCADIWQGGMLGEVLFDTEQPREEQSLEELIGSLKDGFVVHLLKLIDVKGLSDVECYKKANVSKQTWYKMMNEKGYKPSKNTVLSFAIALELTYEQTQELLETVGFALSKSNRFDVIIEYFLLHGEYDIHTVNQTLFRLGEPCLGV